ncbi:hypothetical protein ABZ912_11690 [Nonomuraea angiospora]|uniref:hypothetical protein n=1 Tax=Nonomuraea angiospora TaxID=46172 RepID=UPI0033DEE1D5
MLACGMTAAIAVLGAAAPAVAAAPRVEDLSVPLEDVLLIGGVLAPGPGGRTVPESRGTRQRGALRGWYARTTSHSDITGLTAIGRRVP